jgi:quercetin dioxygenase-like cupin family protein
MELFDWATVPTEQLSETIARQMITGQNLTVARIHLKAGAVVPEHSHENEQISMMLSGHLKFVLEGKEIVVGPGQTLRIPPHVPHSAVAVDDCLAIDVFSPRREDWLRGDDAYLRGSK